ncbi:MAG: hypothetical protein NTX53_04315 [candidate division WOR-3 bacterium]|nr:hypothetical protein [candidate division WOR-3 bacterium]
MKKAKVGEMRPDYRRDELGPGVRGKYLDAYRSGTNLILLSPDVAKAFPTEDAVNEALRSLVRVAQRTASATKRAVRRVPASRQ